MEVAGKKSWAKHLKESFLIFLVGVIFNILTCLKCLSYLPYSWRDYFYSGLLWIVFWKGNEWVADTLDRFFRWKEQPTQRFITGIIGHVLFTFMASVIMQQSFEWIENGQFEKWSWQQVLGFNLPAVIIALIVSLFLTARGFLISWRDLAVQHEKLKSESMASRFASLKAQVNPHFMFNSLNVLSGLVYKDADLSARFIRKLSEVYRYVLDRQEEELVLIGEELEFVDSVVFLQRIRFGENLQVQIDIPRNAPCLVPPLALQMLIENAIKHNVISEDKPLHIWLKVETPYLVISNNLQPKKVLSESLGIGLDNIKKRYSFLTDKSVKVLHDSGQFIVKLPIIQS